MTTFEKIIALLDQHQARYRIVEHDAIGQTEQISQIRGNALDQAAKAIVLTVAMPDGAPSRQLLAIVPGDCRINVKRAAQAIGGKKASFAPPALAQDLTGCVMGAVPPFSFDDRLALRVDIRLQQAETLWFNAGELDKSIALAGRDYFHIAGNECWADLTDHCQTTG